MRAVVGQTDPGREWTCWQCYRCCHEETCRGVEGGAIPRQARDYGEGARGWPTR